MGLEEMERRAGLRETPKEQRPLSMPAKIALVVLSLVVVVAAVFALGWLERLGIVIGND
jgi:hypothetical protein